jgi:TPR repeat protein
MLVKCEKCGYENFPQHRYCGMCAAELRLPGVGTQPAPPPRVPAPAVPQYTASRYKETVTPAKEADPQPLSGPSFLGLGDEPSEKSVGYLLEDDTPRHYGRNVILILLMAGVVAAAWHWRQDLRVVAERFLSGPPPAAKAGGSDSQEPNPPAAADSTSSAAPAGSASAVDKPGSDANAQVAQAQAPQAAAPAAPSGTVDSTQPTQTDQSPSNQSQIPNPSPAGDAASTGAAAKADESEEAPNPPARARKSDMTKAQRVAAAASRTDELEAQGEKYLYGNGVPENCARARTNLLAAAQHSNAQAQSVLGTMYATGHCATRDLPTAYRWFGRSLRQDPKNTRLEQDLRVLWNQMTPGERQLALRDVR